MQEIVSEALGLHRVTATEGWGSAVVRFDREHLTIRPGSVASDLAPEVTWAFAEVASIRAVTPASDGQLSVEITFFGGSAVQATLPTQFVADLCAQIAASSAAVDGTEPMSVTTHPRAAASVGEPHRRVDAAVERRRGALLGAAASALVIGGLVGIAALVRRRRTT